MRTLATAVAMATVLTVPAAAKTLLKNPQRLLPDYVSASDVKNIPDLYIDQWTEGYPPDQAGERSTFERIGTRSFAFLASCQPARLAIRLDQLADAPRRPIRQNACAAKQCGFPANPISARSLVRSIGSAADPILWAATVGNKRSVKAGRCLMMPSISRSAISAICRRCARLPPA